MANESNKVNIISIIKNSKKKDITKSKTKYN